MGFFLISCSLNVSGIYTSDCFVNHKLRILVNGLLLIINYMYEDFLTQIKDYPSWNLKQVLTYVDLLERVIVKNMMKTLYVY